MTTRKVKMKTILLLGSGELGKEITISAKRLGFKVIACDNYNNAPAMQVADEWLIFNMLDGKKLSEVVYKYNPDVIVPEVEAIRTEILLELEKKQFNITPSAKAVHLTMNRDRIRDRAKYLSIKTANFSYAESEVELDISAKKIGYPLVIKPVMSSSGKGQSIVYNKDENKKAWQNATKNMRGDRPRVIVEEFINFDFEITLLSILQKNNQIIFCEPIGHKQERGDYQESWQPQNMSKKALNEAKNIASKIIKDLGGAGLFGVEFFVVGDEVIFSELSPRPHDTGMVTMYTQNLNEFDLHVRAIFGFPIPKIELIRPGASYAILAGPQIDKNKKFSIDGIKDVLSEKNIEIRIFGKPTARPNRRMGVILGPNRNQTRNAIKKINIRNY